jgi:DNA processing protein
VWSRIAEPGDHAAGAFVDRLGPCAALAAVVGGDPAVPPRWRVRLPGADPRADLATLDRLGGRLLVPGDPHWPTGLDDLGTERPFCLWVRGTLPGPGHADPGAGQGAAAPTRSGGPVTRPAVALVGSRVATPYGEQVAVELAAGCARQGYPVVSGAAFGIDAAAHRGALTAGGHTVAVLACGVDRPYPRSHTALIERLARDGAVVSEVPPGSSPTRWRFVERNRLIAALAEVTVVVEAGLRSGASITAGRAARLNRTVAAVPGPVTSPASAGCHHLLRQGAVCVTDAAEVLELLAPLGSPPVAAPAAARRHAEHDGLPPADLRVYDALPLTRGVPLDSVAHLAALDLPAVGASMSRLELAGLAVRDAAGWRRARPPG